ncbi:RD21L protein, partial [Upupa epops]|nr:RD21L protein [Upupa epops]
MFYMHLLVNKRGPLAKIWLAAHWEKKLTKAHIFECNLETTVEKIISPKFTIALRTSGHLLLGVVRIYHRKAKYLLADCSEALSKMKTAFRPGLVDLPSENFEAAYQSITLPEEFHDFEAPLPDVNAIDVAEHFTLNQSRAEDITLTEDYQSNILLCDRTFGERNEEPDALRKRSVFDGSTLMSSNSLMADHNHVSMNSDNPARCEETYCLEHDCFGDEENAADMIEILLRSEQNGLDKDMLDLEEERSLSQEPPENGSATEANGTDTTVRDVSHLMNETVLLLGEEEFVLEPVDDTAVSQRKKNKRKRKLLVDAMKELSCHTIYNQINNCSDTLTTLDLAPPTKKTMEWKKSGGVENLLSQAVLPVFHEDLQKLFAKCFDSRGVKMRRDGAQVEAEMEETRKEHDTMVEEPSYLQDSVQSENERKMRNDLLMLTSQSNGHDPDDVAMVSISHSFLETSVEQTYVCGAGTTLPCMEEITVLTQKYSQDSNSIMSRQWGLVGSLVNCSLTTLVPDPLSVALIAQLQQDLQLATRSFSILGHNFCSERKGSEEIRWSKRTLPLLNTLQHLKRSGVSSVPFWELCRENSRKEAAAIFYILLVLKKQSVIELTQSAPFADIMASPGPKFHTH